MGRNLLAEPRNNRPNEITAILITRHMGSSMTNLATRNISAMTTPMTSGSTRLRTRLAVRSGRLKKKAM
jgi:hypothetical protein